jgi:iron complex transport system ATP-binding protein
VTPLLAVDDVRFSYGSLAVLSGVTFAVQPGEILALVGPNGVGKTTLLKVLAGLRAPCSGRVTVFTQGPATMAYLAQSEELPPDWSVREVVELGRLPYVGRWRHLQPQDDRAVRWAMHRMEILPLASRLIATLSGGERQRVALARALAQESRALLLDEPTAHLDLCHQVDLFRALRAEAARGVGVVAVMHDLGFAAQADRCVIISRGTVRADGPPVQVLRPDLLREVFGTDVEVLRTSDDRIVIAPLPSPMVSGGRASRNEKDSWKNVVSS